jgi:hypothetical protein
MVPPPDVYYIPLLFLHADVHIECTDDLGNLVQ